jgi:DNA-binding LacI/PurR family transcriptional regulator
VITPETRQLLGPNIPIISVATSDESGSPSVAIDDEQAAYDATRHLLRLGHRRIGLLTGDPASIYVAQPRQRGYTSTSLHVNPPLSTMAQPLEAMVRMAVKKLLRSRDLGPEIMPHRLIEVGSLCSPPVQLPAHSSPPNLPTVVRSPAQRR